MVFNLIGHTTDANGQGEMVEETKANLRQAIELILEDRKADILRGLPDTLSRIRS